LFLHDVESLADLAEPGSVLLALTF